MSKIEDKQEPLYAVSRRAFLGGAGAVVAASGIEGVLAARRAPAFAQGTKLHWVR